MKNSADFAQLYNIHRTYFTCSGVVVADKYLTKCLLICENN